MHMEKLMVYFAMVFSIVLELLQMRYNKKVADYNEERIAQARAEGVEEAEETRDARDEAVEALYDSKDESAEEESASANIR